MEDKCFCHLNGYRVKDAEARNRIEVLEDKVENSGYKVEIPLGLCPYGANEYYNTELSDECKTGLTELVNELFSEFSNLADGEIGYLNLNIINTSSEATVEGVTIQNPTPRSLRFDRISINRKDEEITANSITLYGVISEKDGFYLGNNRVSKYDAHLNINFDGEEGSYNIIDSTLALTTFDLPTKKYVDEACSNYRLELNDSFVSGTSNSKDLTANELNLVQTMIQTFGRKGENARPVLATRTYDNDQALLITTGASGGYYCFTGIKFSLGGSNGNIPSLYLTYLEVRGSWDDNNTFTCVSGKYTNIDFKTEHLT